MGDSGYFRISDCVYWLDVCVRAALCKKWVNELPVSESPCPLVAPPLPEMMVFFSTFYMMENVNY